MSQATLTPVHSCVTVQLSSKRRVRYRLVKVPSMSLYVIQNTPSFSKR